MSRETANYTMCCCATLRAIATGPKSLALTNSRELAPKDFAQFAVDSLHQPKPVAAHDAANTVQSESRAK